MEEYKRFTVSLPRKLYEEFEKFRERLGLSRSDSIRKAMKAYMVSEENIKISSGNVVGCITLIMKHEHFTPSKMKEIHDHASMEEHDLNHAHDHEFESMPIYATVQQADEILKNDIQHHFNDIIISTMHVHLAFEKCLEILAISGPHERVLKLKHDLQKLKSIISISLFIVDQETI